MTNEESQYHPEMQLQIEVENRCSNLAVGKHVVPAGKQRIEILAKELPLFQALLEEEGEEYERCKRAFQRKLDEVDRMRLPNGKLLDNTSKDIKRKVLSYTQSAEALFRDTMGRDIKPLFAVTVVKELGLLQNEKNIMEQALESLTLRAKSDAKQNRVLEQLLNLIQEMRKDKNAGE